MAKKKVAKGLWAKSEIALLRILFSSKMVWFKWQEVFEGLQNKEAG